MKKLSHEEIQESKPSVEEVKNMERNPIYVVLDNIRSLYNVGSIFRTSDAAMIEKLYLCGITGSPPRKEIDKTALGACEVVPWEYKNDAGTVLRSLKEEGVRIVAVELAEGAVSYNEFEYDGPICFVFGHEVNGISDELMELCDDAVYVPMAGRANSLNVATCYGIVIFDRLLKI